MRMSQTGLSLLELLVGISLTAVGGLLIMGILVSSNNVFINQTIQVSQGLSLNQASLEVTDLIKSSAGAVTQYPPSGAVQYQTGPEVLVLKIPATSATGQIIDSVFDYAVISQDSASPKILRKHVFPDNQSSRKSENKVLSTALRSITFTYLDSGNNAVPASQASRIKFIINLSEGAAKSPQESSSSSTINLKNVSI